MPIVRVSASPTITAGTFAVGDAVGTQLSFSTGEAAGSIIGCRVLDKGRQSVPLELWLFRASTTGSGLSNNDPFGPSDTQIANSAGVVRVSDWFDTPENSVGQAEELPLGFADLTGGLLYGWLVCRGAPTYAAGDLTVELQIQQRVGPIDRRRIYYYRKRQYPALTGLDITPTANYHTIHLKFSWSQEPASLPPNTVSITGSYLLGGRWVDFHPALRDEDGRNVLYTILFGLQEGKTYPAKIEFKRTNSATGAMIERRTYHKDYTTRVSPQSGTGGTRYMSPSGDDGWTGENPTNSPDGTGPKKTIIGLAGAIPSGGVGVMLNDTYGRAAADGGYDFSSLTQWTVTDIADTAGNYKTIRAETAGEVIISGKYAMTTANGLGSWNLDSTDVYYADFSAFMDTTLKWGPKFVRKESKTSSITSSANNAGNVQLTVASGHGLSQGDRITISGHSEGDYNISARITAVGSTTLDTDIPHNGNNGSGGTWTSAPRYLYHYYSLAVDGAAAGPGDWPAMRNGTREGFLIDWKENRIYVRVPAGNGAPADGRYSAGWHKGQALDFIRPKFLIVEGLTFEMFGSIERVGGTTPSGSVGASISNPLGNVRLNVGANHDLASGSRITITDHDPATYDGTTNVTIPTGSISSSTSYESPPKVRFTVAAGHGLIAGDSITISGHREDSSGNSLYNTSTTITVANSTTLDTNIPFTATGSDGVWMANHKVDTDVTHTSDGNGGGWTLAGHYSSRVLFGAASKNGLRIYGTTAENVVIRNCTFNQASLAQNDPGQAFITIEDCEFAGHDWWTQLFDNPLVNTTWKSIKNTTNEDYMVMFQLGTSGLVIRRCAFSGCDDGISLDTTDGNNDCDIYENSFTNMFDGAIEFNHPDVVCKNGAIWHNTFTNGLNAIRFTVLKNGPVWVIGNDGRGDCGYFFLVYISGGSTNYGWKLIYNNTFITTTKLQNPPATNSAACQTLGSGAGRVVAINNILQAPEDYIGSLDDAVFPAVNVFTKNAFFVPSPGTKRWIFDGVPVNPNTEARYLEVAGSAVSFSGNIYDIEPYPNGIDEELATGLAGKADSIAGITNIAADETGAALSEPLNLGYFPKWES